MLNKYTKFLTSAGLSLTVLATPVVANVFSNAINNPVQAYYVDNNLENLISNNKFTSFSSSTKPSSPNSWTAINPTNSKDVKAGVINTHKNVYAENIADYGLENVENPEYPKYLGTPVNENDALYSNLMINNTSDRTERFGYESSSFTLDANSYYSIHVHIKTTANSKSNEDKARASIYLTGLKDNNISAKFENFETTANEFDEYVLYISTHALQSETVKLQLWLGGNKDNLKSLGSVFINSVNVKKYDEQSFKNRTKNLEANSEVVNHERLINLNSGIENAASVDNANFQLTDSNSTIYGWSPLSSTPSEELQMAKIVAVGANYKNPINNVEIKNPDTCGSYFGDGETDYALFMYNKANASLGIKSSSLTIEKHALYRLSVMAKSDCGIGNGATLKVVQDVEKGTTATPQSASVKTAVSVTENAFTHGWSEYSFYIEGNALNSTNVHLEIWLGTNDEKTNGYVFIDSIKLMNVTREQYNTGAGNANSTTLNLNAGTSDTDLLVKNGNFNLTDNEVETPVYPIKPRNWTFVNDSNVDEKLIFSGIINTNEETFESDKNKFSYPETLKNPGEIQGSILGSNNNVLAVGSSHISNIYYKNDAVAVEANSFYKLTFVMQTQISRNPNADGGARVALTLNDTVVFEHSNINTTGWKTYTLYVKTGTAGNIALNLGLSNISGYAFYDNVTATKLSNFTNDDFNKIINSTENLEQAVDLSKDSFDSYDVSSNGIFAKPTNWEFEKVSGFAPANHGIFNFANNNITNDKILPSLSVNPGTNSGKNALVIYAHDETHSTYKSKQTYKLESGKYYKISVAIRTVDIVKYNEDGKPLGLEYDKDGNPIKYGAYFGLTGISENFSGINSDYYSDNKYVTYTYYVNPTSEITTNIVLGIGAENNLVTGAAFFDDVMFEELEESSYVSATNTLTGSEYNIINVVKTETENNEENDSSYENPEINWLILPSVLLSIALLIAIIGTLLRRINFKHTLKINTKYDRRITLDKEMDRRERIELRNQIISELEAELNSVNKELENLIKKFDEEEIAIKKANKEFVENVIKTKEQLETEKQTAIEEHKKLIQTAAATEKTDKAEKEFIKNIASIEKQQKLEEAKLNAKDKAMAKLQLKRKQSIEMYEEKRKNLIIEINKIEQEIKDIQKEEDIMWSEYSKAKASSKAKNKQVKENATSNEQKPENVNNNSSNEISAENNELKNAEETTDNNAVEEKQEEIANSNEEK